MQSGDQFLFGFIDHRQHIDKERGQIAAVLDITARLKRFVILGKVLLYCSGDPKSGDPGKAA